MLVSLGHVHTTNAAALVSSNATSSAIVESNGNSKRSSISNDGEIIAFSSGATNLTSDNDTNGVDDVFVYQRSTGFITRITDDTAICSAGGPVVSGDGKYVTYSQCYKVYRYTVATGDTELVTYNGFAPDISDNGQYIVYHNNQSGLGNPMDVFRKDMVNNTTILVSVSPAGTDVAGRYSIYPSISADGNKVAFEN